MVDWNSPANILKSGIALSKMVNIFFGIYIWDFLCSFWFDWEFLSGKRKFKWPMLAYFVCRYSMLASAISLIISIDGTGPMNCHTLGKVSEIIGYVVINCASTNLALRTLALWRYDLRILIPIVLLQLGMLSVVFRGGVVDIYWDPQLSSCVPTSTEHDKLTKLLPAVILSMAVDLTVLPLTYYKLSNHLLRTPTIQMLLRDGLIYFIAMFIAHATTVIVICMNVNTPMLLATATSAGSISALVSLQAVRRLYTINQDSRSTDRHRVNMLNLGQPSCAYTKKDRTRSPPDSNEVIELGIPTITTSETSNSESNKHDFDSPNYHDMA